MERYEFEARLQRLIKQQQQLFSLENQKSDDTNGIVQRYLHPVVTAAHAPIFWRYDLNYDTNPHLLERLGINATFNCGAIAPPNGAGTMPVFLL